MWQPARLGEVVCAPYCSPVLGGELAFYLNNASPPRTASLLSARALAALHRRRLALQTMGDDAMCVNPIQPTLPKTQYKFEQVYPVPEANDNHWSGEPTYLWGEWRNLPGVGEDYVNLIWRWDDFCTQF